jgi:hypothetical protein
VGEGHISRIICAAASQRDNVIERRGVAFGESLAAQITFCLITPQLCIIGGS